MRSYVAFMLLGVLDKVPHQPLDSRNHVASVYDPFLTPYLREVSSSTFHIQRGLTVIPISLPNSKSTWT